MTKYERINRAKLTDKGKVFYDKIVKATDGFKNKEAVKKNKAVLDKFYDRVKAGLPEAIKPVKSKKSKTKPKAKAKKPAYKNVNMGNFAKETSALAKKEGISYKEAQKKMSAIFKERKAKAQKKQGSDFDKMIAGLKKKVEYRGGKGLTNTTLKKDAKLDALDFGKRTSKGTGANQYGKAKKGRTYYEYRNNRADVKNAPPSQPYPKLESGGKISEAGDVDFSEKLLGYAKGGEVELKEISTPQLYSILKLKFTQSIQTNTDYKVGKDVYFISDGFGSKRLDDDKLYLYKKTKGGNELIGVLKTTYAKGGVTKKDFRYYINFDDSEEWSPNNYSLEWYDESAPYSVTKGFYDDAYLRSKDFKSSKDAEKFYNDNPNLAYQKGYIIGKPDYAKGGHLDNARERIIDYFINNDDDEELISRMGYLEEGRERGEKIIEDRDKNYDDIYQRVSDGYDDDDIEYYFEMYLDDGSGSGNFAKGGMTKEIENDFNMPKFLKDQIIDKDGKRKIDDKSIEMLTDYTNNVMPQTKDVYFKDGKYTKERQKLHKQIINEFKGDLVCIQQDEPIAILMGGSPASGKSTFLRKYAPYLLDDEILRIDADETRSRLPEYDGWNASATHLETKDIVNTLLSDRTIGLPCEYDIIYDGTMNNTKAYLPLIKLLKKLGYKIYVVYVDNVPKSVIEKRVKERYQKSGRFVPLEVVDDFFSKGKTALNEIKKKVDGYMVIDGSDSNYRIIEEGGMKLPKSRKYSQIGTAIDKMATGGEVFSEQIARGYDVNLKSGTGTYAKGGEVDFARGGTIYDIGDEVKDRRFGNDLGVIKGYNEEYYFIKHQDGEDATGLMFWIGQEDEEDRGRYYNLSEIILSEDYDDYENDRFARYKVMVGEEEESDDLTKDDAEDLAYRLKRIGAKDVKVERMIYARGGKTKKNKMKKDDNWIQGVDKEMERKGTKGAFTKQAKRAGMSTVAFAKEVLRSPDKYSEKTRERAQFMKNVNPELFEYGGKISEAGDVDFPEKLLGYAKGGKLSNNDMVIIQNTYTEIWPRLRDNLEKNMKRVGITSDSKEWENKGKYYKQIGKLISSRSFAEGGSVDSFSHEIARGFDVNLKSGTGTYAKGGKTQGYNARLDKSLAMRDGSKLTKKVNYKGRRDESKGEEKALGKRAYSSVDTMDDAMLDLENFYEKGGKVLPTLYDKANIFVLEYMPYTSTGNRSEQRKFRKRLKIQEAIDMGNKFFKTGEAHTVFVYPDHDVLLTEGYDVLYRDGGNSYDDVGEGGNSIGYAKGGEVKDVDRFGITIVQDITYENQYGYDETYENTTYETRFKTEKEANDRADEIEKEDEKRVYDIYEYKIPSKVVEAWNKLRLEDEDFCEGLDDFFEENYDNYAKGGKVKSKLSKLKKGDKFYFPLNKDDEEIGRTNPFDAIYVFNGKIKSTYHYTSDGSKFSTSTNRDVVSFAKGGELRAQTITIKFKDNSDALSGEQLLEDYYIDFGDITNYGTELDVVVPTNESFEYREYIRAALEGTQEKIEISSYAKGGRTTIDTLEKAKGKKIWHLKYETTGIKGSNDTSVKVILEDGSAFVFDSSNRISGFYQPPSMNENAQNLFPVKEYDFAKGGKTQGYNARLDESLAMRRGKAKSKKQSKKDRRDESKAMEKAKGKRAYSSVKTMDKKVKYRGKK